LGLPPNRSAPRRVLQRNKQITDKIVIQGLEFYAYHGASDQEQAVGHRYEIDVELSVDTRAAAESDRLHDTVSYSRVARRLVQIGTQQQYRLLEALAGRMAQTVLEDFPTVQTVKLRVNKLCPPMNAIVAAVGVEITRDRWDTAPERCENRHEE
jgi:dihydroneopterin aldolase